MEPKPTNADEKDLRTHAIIGAAMEVHSQLGHGFLEPVYQAALEIELAHRGIPFIREGELTITYKQTPLPCKYQPDCVGYGQIIVELKALSAITGVEQAQVINYLKATGLELGLLINFGTQRLQFKRFVLSRPASEDYSEQPA